MNLLFLFRITITWIIGLVHASRTHAFAPSGGNVFSSREASSLFLRTGYNAYVIGGSSYVGRNHRHSNSLQMSVEGDFDPEAISKAKEAIESGSIKARFNALYKFTRPHTIRGSILASIAGTVRALLDTPGAIHGANWGLLLPRAFIGMISLLLGNVFIVGINQIYDKEIDEMNKPFLPVASGEMSKNAAWAAVVTSAVVGPILVKNFFPPLLFQLYSFGLVLGGIYSVPPIRTKKNPVLAGLTIATVRGFLLNFGVYYAVKDAIGAPFAWSPKVAFIARFMTAFATVIAVTKDLPDVEGDKAYQIDTLATRLGVKRIAQGATLCLGANYIHAILTGVLAKSTAAFRMVPMIGGHVALASMLIFRYKQLNPESMASVKKYYKHIWDLFYLEYGLYTLI
uniref:Homogentisate solanesyltransferase n=1 Tax=Pseudo-nitzschia australis TaxID=44445 RepID=A0A7S4A8X4_9STRA|mmetsp:Transcript_116/g.305  ORF Transcript_116/g.305 Transcript_116/m.305 type:complete len:398 (+) Transcript_116:356-1549(+)|eukprot:CAMPEP_0168180406 /NCGR_PEP_ID=MMETSP0139_2-20121125/10507_1 /TAXON_ID=44445 /ORGANISM="Pseudo-nitzschia australis, Strain 10249 10 AB" /LENGTH=397 /DNA_ID=CAMNT_0008100595 /DNA_START=293 /DNA_END=1486 /DNA_ORIENTATION=+